MTPTSTEFRHRYRGGADLTQILIVVLVVVLILYIVNRL